MVQLTDCANNQMETSTSPGMFIPLHTASLQQLPHTLLTQQPTLPHLFPILDQFLADTAAQPSHGAYDLASAVQNGDCSQHFVPDLGPSEDSCTQATTSFAGSYSVSSIPTTRLDASFIVTASQDSPAFQSLPGDMFSDVSKAFEVIPVTPETQIYRDVDSTQGEEFSGTENPETKALYAVDASAQGNSYLVDLRVDSVDSLSDSKGYSSDSSSDVYMCSEYTDTINSADSSALLLAAARCKDDGKENAQYRKDTTSFTENASDVSAPCYSNEAFVENGKDLISWSSDDSESVSGKVELDDAAARTDSWIVSTSKILEGFSDRVCSGQIPQCHTQITPSVVESAQKATTCYNKEALTDINKELISWIMEKSVQEMAHVDRGESRSEDCAITVPEEDSGVDGEQAEELVLPQDTVMENLMQRLEEQHPSDIVDIQVQVLDGPVYHSLTEPAYQENWLQSTESLHQYKLMKQGRVRTDSLGLNTHSLKNLRANTMNNLHERHSFVNLTATSVSNLARVCQQALSYVRADMEFGSMMSLRNNLNFSTLTLRKGQMPGDLEVLSGRKGRPTVVSGRHTRNVLYMALLVTILLISINATRNLQSSLNQEGGVGVICLAVMYASYMLGSLLSPVMVQGLGVKKSVTGGLVLQLLYVAANLYPAMWLMVPASLGGGASLALIWNAMSTYLVLLARGEADSKQKPYDRVSDRYFGLFCLIYQSNLIVGNLIASLILTFGDGNASSAAGLVMNDTGVNSGEVNMSDFSLAVTESTHLSPLHLVITDLLGSAVGEDGVFENFSSTSATFDVTKDSHYHLCGSAYCHHFAISRESSAVSDRTIYLLFGIFMFLVVVAILITVFLLEPLSSRVFSAKRRAASPWHSVKHQFVSLIKFCRNVKFLFLLPLMLYSVMQFSFVCSEVMMAYVTCPAGVWLVGYTMMAYGVSCSVSSYITQALVSKTGRGFFVGLAAALNVGLLLFMRLWQPHPDSVLPLFVITSLFGFADGIWNVNANGLCGSVFPDHFEEAFTGLRVAQGLGGAFSMGYSPFFCMAVKIYVMIAVVVVVFVGYVGAEVLIRRELKMKNALPSKMEIS